MNFEQLVRLVRQETKQREEERCDVTRARAELEALAAAEPEAGREMCEEILAALQGLAPDPAYTEPSTLDKIRDARAQGPRRMQNTFSYSDLLERTTGGWLGRCAGCMLGKPVEGWTREEIRAVAVPDDNYPLRDYLSPVLPDLGRRPLRSGGSVLRGNITAMERDDDLDYTVTGLLLLERHGYEFTTVQVADFWLAELPYHKVYTAERVAYRNLVDGLSPAEAGGYRNPCREWIGAQIRADAFGYACPGWPERAAELGFRDAFLSHRKNGIYGEMLVAAMIAAAYVERDIERIIEIGLSEIPGRSRLTEAVERVVEWWRATPSWEAVADRIDESYGALQGCHAITNAAIVILGLLAGADDFTAGLAASIMPGYDTDCNGATTGSILGVRAGAASLPEQWVAPLNDRLKTMIASVREAPISELAERTVRLVESDAFARAEAGTTEPLTWGIS